VQWNQAEDAQTRATWGEKVSGLAPKSEYYTMSNREGELIRRWYFLAILELLRMPKFQADPEWISTQLNGKVSASEVQETLDLLQNLKMVEKGENGWTVNHDILVGDLKSASSEDIREHHKKMNALGVLAMTEEPRERREMSALSIGISEEDAVTLKEKIRKFQVEILDFVQGREHVNSVYQLNIQFFPLTKNSEENVA